MSTFDLRAHTILLAVSGSRAYGLHTDASDVDVRGVAIPPLARLLGLPAPFEQADSAEEIAVFHADLLPHEQAIAERTKLEGSVYALRKLVRLASDCNPNILDVLFCRDAEVRRITPTGEHLRAHRALFLSQRARHSYAGYATAQLKRIHTHRRWLLDPPKAPPERADFDLPPMPEIPTSQLQAAEAAIRKQIDRWEIDYDTLPGSQVVRIQARIARVLAEQGLDADAQWRAAARHVGLHDNLIEHMQRERAYGSARRKWGQFLHWQRSRNPERAALEAEYGYDTKHAAHLVRLLRMGREIMETGQVHVWREHDRDELLGIRRGAWSFDALIEHTDAERAALHEAAAASTLRDRVDREAIDALVLELMGRALGVDL